MAVLGIRRRAILDVIISIESNSPFLPVALIDNGIVSTDIWATEVTRTRSVKLDIVCRHLILSL
jgi:hypothetical protein